MEIVEIYLGPTAQRFVDRQIKFHLKKAPSEVSAEDLDSLTDWMKVAMALLTDDQQNIDECARKLISLK